MTADAGWEEWQPGPYKKFAPKAQLVAEYWLMRTYEPTTKRVLALLRTLILNTLGEYRHPDAAIAERVNGWLSRIEGGMQRVVGDLLSAFWAGFAVAEPIWETEAQEWWVKRVDLLHPLTFFNRNASRPEDAEGIQLDPKTGRVEKVRQFSSKPGGGSAELKIEEVLYWPMFAELREEVLGQSLLAAARRGWFSKTKIENFWNTFAEKAAMPTPVFVVAPGTVKDPATGQDVSIGKLLVDTYAKVTPGMALSIPYVEGLEPKMLTLVPSDGASTTFERLTEYWKNELFNSMFTPRIVLEEPEHASRAQTGTVLDLYYMVIEGLRQEAGKVIVDQLVGPLLEHNVGKGGGVQAPALQEGEWGWKPLQTSDMTNLAQVFETVERGKTEGMMAGLPFVPADERKRRETFPALYAPADQAPEAFGEAAAPSKEQATAKAQAARYG
jgi:hypothetical protein